MLMKHWRNYKMKKMLSNIKEFFVLWFWCLPILIFVNLFMGKGEE